MGDSFLFFLSLSLFYFSSSCVHKIVRHRECTSQRARTRVRLCVCEISDLKRCRVENVIQTSMIARIAHTHRIDEQTIHWFQIHTISTQYIGRTNHSIVMNEFQDYYTPHFNLMFGHGPFFASVLFFCILVGRVQAGTCVIDCRVSFGNDQKYDCNLDNGIYGR